MSSEEIDVNTRFDSDGKNNSILCCQRCSSVILNKGIGSFESHEFDLPHMKAKNAEGNNEKEKIHNYWMIKNMYSFENVGVSNAVGNLKYLACADCEIGPIGYIDPDTTKLYVALSRVFYKDNNKTKQND